MVLEKIPVIQMNFHETDDPDLPVDLFRFHRNQMVSNSVGHRPGTKKHFFNGILDDRKFRCIQESFRGLQGAVEFNGCLLESFLFYYVLRCFKPF